MDENNNLEEQKQQGNEEVEEDGTNWSVKKSMYLLVGVAVVILIGMLFFRQLSVTRKTRKPVESNKAQVEEQENRGVDISTTGDSTEKEVEKEPENVPVDSGTDVGSNSVENSTFEVKPEEISQDVSQESPEVPQSNPQQTTNNVPQQSNNQPTTDNTGNLEGNPSSNNYLVEQDESSLQLSEGVETTGLVSSKNVYRFGGSYIYCINILVLNADGSNSTCQYFCPSKTYGSVNIGESLSVSYQKDASGVISVYSIGASK